MYESHSQLENNHGGETEAKYMTEMLLRSTEAMIPILSAENAQLNRKDQFALKMLKDVMSKLDDDIDLNQTYKHSIKPDNEFIEERVPVLMGGSEKDTDLQQGHQVPVYIDGQSKMVLEYDAGRSLAVLSIDIDLVRNLGNMTLPEGTPTSVSFFIAGNFTDDFYAKIPMDNGLPSVHISFYIHYVGDQDMYSNTLNVDIAPPNFPIETIEERMRREVTYSYKPDLIKALLEGQDISTRSIGKAIAGQIHEDAVIQNLGVVDIPKVGQSRVFLKDENKSIKKVVN